MTVADGICEVYRKDFVLNGDEVNKYIKKINIGFVKELIFLDETTSTFDETYRLKCRNGVVVCTKRQTAGRGRLGRKWESDKGGVYFSVLISAKNRAENLSAITAICAAAVKTALGKYTECAIKWPNDIVSADGKKLCGILTKLKTEGNEISSLDIGIGINVNNESFSDKLKYGTSLKIILENYVNENKLLAEVLEQTGIFLNKKTEEAMRIYAQACINVGRAVRALSPDGKEIYRGICAGINPDATLKLKTEDGKEMNVCSGEFSVRGIYGENYV